MPYPDNHNGAAQDAAMGTGTGGGGRAWTDADYQRHADRIAAGMREAQARIDDLNAAKPRSTETVQANGCRVTITRGKTGTFIQASYPHQTAVETTFIPAYMVRDVLAAWTGLAGDDA